MIDLPPFDPRHVLESGLSLHTGTYFIEGRIDHKLSADVAKATHLLNLTHQPITIFLNTYGGDRAAALGIFDMIRAIEAPVTVIGYGSVLSSGVVILQSGDERLLMQNTELMIHPGHSQTGEDLDENTVRAAAACKANRDRWYGIIAKRMGISLKEMLSKYTMDTWFTAAGAVRVGLADKVIREIRCT